LARIGLHGDGPRREDGANERGETLECRSQASGVRFCHCVHQYSQASSFPPRPFRAIDTVALIVKVAGRTLEKLGELCGRDPWALMSGAFSGPTTGVSFSVDRLFRRLSRSRSGDLPMRQRIQVFSALVLGVLSLPGCGGGDPYDDAETLLVRKRYSPAIVKFDEILLENPVSVRALLGRGRAYAASGDTERAMADFNRAIELAPDRPEAYYRRAMLFELLDEPGKAKADEDYAHSIDPEYRAAFVAMENAMIPTADEDSEQQDNGDEESKVSEVELAASVSTVESGQLRARDFRTFQVPETTMSPRSAQGNSDETRTGSRSELLDWNLGESGLGGPLLDWPQFGDGVGEFQSAAPSRQVGPKADSTKPTEKTTAKTPATAPTARPAVTPGNAAPNPYVRAPVPVTGGATPAASSKPAPRTPVPTGAGNTARPTGSPFPQGPLRGTGRSNTPAK
jgi:tetratricopeptide (TPR) repeat protein